MTLTDAISGSFNRPSGITMLSILKIISLVSSTSYISNIIPYLIVIQVNNMFHHTTNSSGVLYVNIPYTFFYMF